MFRELDKVSQSIYEVINDKVLTSEMCEYIINYVEDPKENLTWHDAPLLPAEWDRIRLNPEYMKAKHKAMAFRSEPQYDDLYDEVIPWIKHVNQEFNFDIVGIRDIQIHKFEVGDERPCATDLFLEAPKSEHRKLVLYLDLNADFQGGRVFMKRGVDVVPIAPMPCKGVAIPAYQLYGVTPVTEGTAYKMAVWACGERFR